jgi:hypothetical protein
MNPSSGVCIVFVIFKLVYGIMIWILSKTLKLKKTHSKLFKIAQRMLKTLICSNGSLLDKWLVGSNQI